MGFLFVLFLICSGFFWGIVLFFSLGCGGGFRGDSVSFGLLGFLVGWFVLSFLFIWVGFLKVFSAAAYAGGCIPRDTLRKTCGVSRAVLHQ